MEANTFSTTTVTTPQLVLTLPLPPSVNHLYATVNGRRVLSRAGRDFKALVAEEVDIWRDRDHISDTAIAAFGRHYLSLSIIFYFTTALRRDLDGGLKIAQDALCEAIGVNDNLVTEIHLIKRVDRQHPRIEVTLQILSTIVLQSGIGQATTVVPFPDTSKRRRRRRKPQRSLEELAIRHNWE